MSATFTVVISRSPGVAGSASPSVWWLSGGISSGDCVAAYQAKGAASLAASYVNLAHPGTNDAAPGVAPTFDTATGWTFNGSTQWLDTGILPTATTSALVQFTNGSGAIRILIGSYSGNDTTRFLISAASGGQRDYEHANLLLVSTAIASGNMAIAGQQGYLDGAADGGAIPGPWAGNATATIGIAKQNGFTSYGAYTCVALAIYSVTITSEQVVAVAAAMAAL